MLTQAFEQKEHCYIAHVRELRPLPSLAPSEYSPLIVWWVVAEEVAHFVGWGREEVGWGFCDWQQSITVWAQANEAACGLLKG
jgi:hypothetical protein